MLTTSRAIVLNTTKYGDSRLLVSMFTEQYGMMSFSASARRKNGVSKTNYFQPLSILELEFDMKPTARIQAIRNMHIDMPASSIPFDARKSAIAMFLSEFMRYALRNEQRNRQLFDFAAGSIEWLDKARGHYSNFHIIFMVQLSRLTGFYPNSANYSPGAWFDIDEGCFSLRQPQYSPSIPPQQASLIPVLSRLSFQTMHLLKLSRSDRNKCTEVIIEYYRRHLPDFPELRSFTVLKELFA